MSQTSRATSNIGMHPTANCAALIVNLCVLMLRARRVMPGVRYMCRVVGWRRRIAARGCYSLGGDFGDTHRRSGRWAQRVTPH